MIPFFVFSILSSSYLSRLGVGRYFFLFAYLLPLHHTVLVNRFQGASSFFRLIFFNRRGR